MAKAGRPRKQVDGKLVEQLAGIGCKVTEIAKIVSNVQTKVSDDLIARNFAYELQKGEANLKMSLRRWQLEAAKKGNVAMLIWLGKQILGQTEKVQQVSDIQFKPITGKQIRDIFNDDPFFKKKDDTDGRDGAAQAKDSTPGADTDKN